MFFWYHLLERINSRQYCLLHKRYAFYLSLMHSILLVFLVLHLFLLDNLAVRFAKIDTMIPNIEMKWTKNKFDKIALEKTIDARIKNETLHISHLELQIAFKEEVLKSPKDLDDAEHIKNVAREYLDNKLIQKYKEMLHGFY